MYHAEVQRMVDMTKKKVDYLEASLPGYLVLSAFAGIYLAFAVGLVFYCGGFLAQAGSPYTKLVMGILMGIALVLVIMAGAELFTGNNMVGVIGILSGTISLQKLLKMWFWCFVGNLLGSLFLAWLLAQSGIYSASPQIDLLQKVAAIKMNMPIAQIFVRGILANWMVCVGVWCAARTANETAKIILIVMCLLAFVAPGYEHSIINMSAMSLPLFLPHDSSIVSWHGYARNLTVSTLGNMIGGGFFVGALYWYTSPVKAAAVYGMNGQKSALAGDGVAESASVK